MLYGNFAEYPLTESASSYFAFDFLDISWLDEFFHSLSSIEFGICLIICGGWFDEVWTYNNLSYGFLNGLYVSFSKWNMKSEIQLFLDVFGC